MLRQNQFVLLTQYSQLARIASIKTQGVHGVFSTVVSGEDMDITEEGYVSGQGKDVDPFQTCRRTLIMCNKKK